MPSLVTRADDGYSRSVKCQRRIVGSGPVEIAVSLAHFFFTPDIHIPQGLSLDCIRRRDRFDPRMLSPFVIPSLSEALARF